MRCYIKVVQMNSRFSNVGYYIKVHHERNQKICKAVEIYEVRYIIVKINNGLVTNGIEIMLVRKLCRLLRVICSIRFKLSEVSIER
ncbi:hypothetical protein RchiOBHm_Chr5g0079451 [Rosa chinensis]|uniref:Uncharacterized protein n=1 Tax=Rosa chinensis TaxID=74649 RepID=A0A2P6QMI3_ROSCH|nr:hypothetical protein RchiOBHm_Chr5g0079451 [Rosa chinensis]